jgi:small-conductance mechanosensitive channel
VSTASLIVLKISDELIFNIYLLRKANVRVPVLFRDILMFTFLAIVVIIMLRIEFGFQLTGILTSSAIVSVIIGFALQDTLANIIAGIVMHIEKPFDIGDWIKVGDREGEVVETSWKATRLRTLEGNYIVIPNTIISKEIIINYHKPTKAHALVFGIGIAYHIPPSKVKEAVLRTISDCSNVLTNPSPRTTIKSFGDSSINYEIRVWIDNHAVANRVQDDILSKLWYSLKREDIQIPFPIRTIYMQKEQDQKDKTQTEAVETKKNIIKNISLFQDIPGGEITHLAELSKLKTFTNEEKIIFQGEEGHSLFIITKGTVNVFTKDMSGNDIAVKDLKEGDYFGEMSLLTGEKRSATLISKGDTTVLEIEAAALSHILHKNPSLIEALSSKLAERKLATKDLLDKAILNDKTTEAEILSKNIFNRIKNFFSGK